MDDYVRVEKSIYCTANLCGTEINYHNFFKLCDRILVRILQDVLTVLSCAVGYLYT